MDYGLSDTAFLRRSGVQTHVIGEIHGVERGAQRVQLVPLEQAAGGYLETIIACLYVLITVIAGALVSPSVGRGPPCLFCVSGSVASRYLALLTYHRCRPSLGLGISNINQLHGR